MHRMLNLPGLPASPDDFDSDTVFETFVAGNSDLMAALERADRIYVNGEGTLHGANSVAVSLLYLMYLARTRLGREVHLINQSSYPEGDGASGESPVSMLYRKVLERLDFVAVREPASRRVLTDLGIDATQSFDCLPLFLDRHSEILDRQTAADAEGRQVVIAGSAAWGGADVVNLLGEFLRSLREHDFRPIVLVGASRFLAADDVVFAERLAAAAPDSFELRLAPSELDWLRAIGNAQLLVSGRFHHTIAAAFLDTPFIVMESNTPKIAGLLELLGVDNYMSVMDAGASLLEASMARLQDPAGYLVDRERLSALREDALANFTD